jgi:hypothetical protein
MAGETDSRVCYKEPRSCPLPLIKPPDTVISTHYLAERNEGEYWSRVYDGGDVIYKQATSNFAAREAHFLAALEGPYFPRVLDVQSEHGYSVVALEKINGLPLDHAKADLRSDPHRLQRFFRHCLRVLEALKMAGITHRDIWENNVLVRDDKPVLIDFGWAVSEAHPIFPPGAAGNRGRPPDGSFCDVYSMGILFDRVNAGRYAPFDLVTALMTEPDASLRITDLDMLRKLFALAASSADDAGVETGASVIFQLLAQMAKRSRRLKQYRQDQWLRQIYLTTRDLAALIPAGATFILVDEDQLRSECAAGGRAIPFLERDGQYWGLPPDDETAIREMERLRRSGATFLVFAWPAFWWLEYYAGLHRYLRANFRCALENDRLVAFDLRRC